MSFSIADSFTWLYFLSLLLMVIFTNIVPYLGRERADIQNFIHTKTVELGEVGKSVVVANQIIIMIMGKYKVNPIVDMYMFTIRRIWQPVDPGGYPVCKNCLWTRVFFSEPEFYGSNLAFVIC